MAQQQFSNGDDLLDVRTTLNSNATDAQGRLETLEAFDAAATAAGLAILTADDAAAQRSALALGTAAGAATTDFDAAGAATAAQSAAATYTDDAVSALENVTVKTLGNQTVAGNKRFSGETKMGTASNHTKFETDGTMVFAGDATVWDDLVSPLLVAKTGNQNIPSFSTFKGNLNAYLFNIGDWLQISTEFLHGYAEGTNFEIHLHWATNGLEAVDKYVKWEVEYTLANMSGTFSTAAVASVEVKIPANTADRTHIYTSLVASVTGTGYKIGTIFMARIRRISSTGDQPNAHPFAISLGVHFEKDTVGSRTETAK